MREAYRKNQHAWRLESELESHRKREHALSIDALFMIQTSDITSKQLETEMLTLIAEGQERLKTWVHG